MEHARTAQREEDVVAVAQAERTAALPVDVGALNREIVLENEIIFGSVNANRKHFELAAGYLAAADRTWLGSLVTRSVPLSEWQSAYRREPDDVKVVLVP